MPQCTVKLQEQPNIHTLIHVQLNYEPLCTTDPQALPYTEQPTCTWVIIMQSIPNTRNETLYTSA